MSHWNIIIQDKFIRIRADGIHYDLDTGSISFISIHCPEIPIAVFKTWDSFWKEEEK